eukprot:SAG11_NODE_17836_length_507_cov_2.061275_1_plen_38_part_01
MHSSSILVGRNSGRAIFFLEVQYVLGLLVFIITLARIW